MHTAGLQEILEGYYRLAIGLRWRFSGVTCDAAAANQIITNQYIGLVNRVGTNVNASFNGAPLTVAGGTSGSMVLTTIMRGSGSASAYVGDTQELIFYNDDKSTSDQASINSNIGDYFTQNTPLLDTYSGAAAAYSLRLLDSSYVGSAIRVRRSSDNTEQDIGFNVFGELDTVSLLAFAGTGDAFVKTWYDQSGSSNDATRTTTANQPQIVSSGAVILDNGKPAVEFTGSHYLISGTISATGTATNFAVGQITGGSGNRTLFYTPEIFNLYNGANWNFLTISTQVNYGGVVETQALHYFGANSTQGFGGIDGGTITTNAQGAGSGTKNRYRHAINKRHSLLRLYTGVHLLRFRRNRQPHRH